MNNIINLIYTKTNWLYTIIYQNNFLYIDYWTFNHLWSGAILFLILHIILKKNQILIFVFLLVGYEIIEILFRIFALNLFNPEIIVDQIYDLAVGLAGYYLSNIFLILFKQQNVNKKRFPFVNPFTSFVAAGTLSYLWVGFYGYKYNHSNLNIPGFNPAAFIFWVSSMYGLIQIFELLQRRKDKKLVNIILLWLIYFPILLIIEYISYYLVGLHEKSSGLPTNDLIFGVVHGTPILHMYYLLAPFTSVLVYLLLKKLRDKAELYYSLPHPIMRLFQRLSV